MTLFVTGPRGAGKTTFCTLLFYHLTAEVPVGPDGAGSLALFSRRAPGDVGYDLEIRECGGASAGSAGKEKRSTPLARHAPAAPEWSGGNLGPWVFSQDAFDRAGTSFDRAFDGLRQGALFVLDEVGPLELTLGRGYAPLLPRASTLPRFVTVVRPGLVETLRAELTRHANAPRTTVPEDRVTLVEVEPGALEDYTERRRLLRRATEALS